MTAVQVLAIVLLYLLVGGSMVRLLLRWGFFHPDREWGRERIGLTVAEAGCLVILWPILAGILAVAGSIRAVGWLAGGRDE